MRMVIPGTEEEHIAYMSTMLLINSSGLIINMLCVLMFFKFRNELLISNNNKLLFSMAMGDLLVALFGVIGAILYYLLMIGKVDVSAWKLGGVLPMFGSFFISILTIGTMTLDRLVVVLLHLRYHLIMTNHRLNFLIAFIWLIPTAVIIMQALLFFCISPPLELKVRSYLMATFFIVGTVTLAVANSKLHCIVKQKRQEVSVINHDVHVSFQRPSLRPAKVNLLNNLICIWMTALFIICWIPITVFYVMAMNGYQGSRTSSTVVTCLASSNSLLNPVIYLMKRKDFRKHFAKFC